MKTIFVCLLLALFLTACEGQNKKPTTAPMPPATPAADSVTPSSTPDGPHKDTASYDRMSGRGYDSVTKQ